MKNQGLTTTANIVTVLAACWLSPLLGLTALACLALWAIGRRQTARSAAWAGRIAAAMLPALPAFGAVQAWRIPAHTVGLAVLVGVTAAAVSWLHRADTTRKPAPVTLTAQGRALLKAGLPAVQFIAAVCAVAVPLHALQPLYFVILLGCMAARCAHLPMVPVRHAAPSAVRAHGMAAVRPARANSLAAVTPAAMPQRGFAVPVTAPACPAARPPSAAHGSRAA